MQQLQTASKMVGVKQCRKAIKEGLVARVYLACDAEERVLAPLRQLCRELNLFVVEAPSMQELGRQCGIEVGASVAVILKN